MKDYVRELSKEYTLVPTSDNPNDGGLEYGDDKVWYTDVIVEHLDQFNEMSLLLYLQPLQQIIH